MKTLAVLSMLLAFAGTAPVAMAQAGSRPEQPKTVDEVVARVRDAWPKRIELTLRQVNDWDLRHLALLRLVRDEDREMQLAAVRELRNWGWGRSAMSPAAASEFDEVTKMVVGRHVADGFAPRDAKSAIEHLRRLGLTDASLEPALAMLADANAPADARSRAASLLSSLEPVPAKGREAFAAALRTGNERLGTAALEWFIKRAKDGGEVVRAMRDPDARVRTLAIQRASWLVRVNLVGRAAMQAVLQERAASDPDPAVRRLATGMMGLVADVFLPNEGRGELAAALTPLVSAFRDARDAPSRDLAGQALAQQARREDRAAEVAAAVAPLLDEGQPAEVRRAAAEWYRRDELRREAPVDRLYALVADPPADDPEITRAAAGTLKEIFKHGITGPVTRARLDRLTDYSTQRRPAAELIAEPAVQPLQVYPAAPTPAGAGNAGDARTFGEKLNAVAWPVTFGIGGLFLLLLLARFATP